MGHMMWKVHRNMLCNHDPKSRSKVNCILVKCKHTIILIVFCVQDVMTDVTADSDAQAHQELHCLSIRHSVKSAHPQNNFLISQPKRMMYVVGTQKKRLNETVLLNTPNIC